MNSPGKKTKTRKQTAILNALGIALILPLQCPAVSADVATELTVVQGQATAGQPTPSWLRAIAPFHDKAELQIIAEISKPFTVEERHWADLIRRRVTGWSGKIAELLVPFDDVNPPASVMILLGNVGGNDAFIAEDTNIAFDVSRLNEIYGTASTLVNADRVDRLFAHEFTHLLHKEWRRVHQPRIESYLEQALWACLTEGLGVYRSLSERWTDERGVLSAKANETLARLQPIFVDRLSRLEFATSNDVNELTKGLSLASFEEKWGALPVALWLAVEARDGDIELRKWVAAGPWGVIDLAQRHLPPELARSLPQQPAR